ncbi:MAG TPA: potassium-transporting ATPase subunit C [Acidimicrobiales bacterium]|nr:potassium-transporting ATPase subunit C [Acidimicrobiales bacterium]
MFRRQLIPAIVLTIVVAIGLGIVYPVVVWGIGQVGWKSKVDGSFVSRDGQVVGSTLIGQQFVDKNGNPLPQYFQSRPSDAFVQQNILTSGASNLGPGDPRLVGFIPGFNTVDLNGDPSKTNPFATPQDPYCVPLNAATGNPVISGFTSVKLEKSDGQYTCDPNTVPERAMAYRQLNDLPANTSVPVDAVTASGSGEDPDISVANADLQAPRVAHVRHLSLSEVQQLIAQNTTGRYVGVLGEPGVNVLELNLALDRLGT